MIRLIAIATILAGTLDILFAVVLTLLLGGSPDDMLRAIGSGLLPQAVNWGAYGVAVGLAAHFALMGVMAAAFVLAAAQWPVLARRPVKWGTLYGLATYVVMNLVVVPLRFPNAFPPKPIFIFTQVFAHIVLVGIPIALIVARRQEGLLADDEACEHGG